MTSLSCYSITTMAAWKLRQTEYTVSFLMRSFRTRNWLSTSSVEGSGCHNSFDSLLLHKLDVIRCLAQLRMRADEIHRGWIQLVAATPQGLRSVWLLCASGSLEVLEPASTLQWWVY